MKKFSLSIDDSLIISRLQQKELINKPSLSLIEHLKFNPITSTIPIKLGLSIKLLGSKIISIHIDRGYYYQGIENRLPTLSYSDALQHIALLNLKTPIFYQLAFTRAMENLCDIDVTPNTNWMRSWACIVARIYHHVHVLSDVFLALDRDNLNDLALTILNMLKPTADILCRVHNITPKNTLDSFELINLLESLETISQELEASLDFDVKIRQLLRKKAVVTLNMAASFGLSGIYLRANRSSYEIIPTDGPPHELSEGGDAWARINLRAGELRSGITWLKQSLSTALAENKTLEPLCDNRELSIAQTVHTFSFGEISGPEGDIKISIFLDKQKIPNIHLRSPAFFIAQALPHLLAQADISDLLWILYSLGISAEEIDK